MISERELRIIAGFYPDPVGRTIKELEKASRYSYERVNTALKSLVDKGIARSKRVGNVLTYDLQIGRYEALLGFMFAATERTDGFKRRHNNIFEEISRFANRFECDCAVIFGSYSKGSETKNSDIDLLLIGEQPELDREARSLERYILKDVNALVVPKKGFWEIRRDNPVFFDELVKYGIVLKGYETYYEMVYRWELWSKKISVGIYEGNLSKGGPSCQRSPRFIWRRPGRTWSR